MRLAGRSAAWSRQSVCPGTSHSTPAPETLCSLPKPRPGPPAPSDSHRSHRVPTTAADSHGPGLHRSEPPRRSPTSESYTTPAAAHTATPCEPTVAITTPHDHKPATCDPTATPRDGQRTHRPQRATPPPLQQPQRIRTATCDPTAASRDDRRTHRPQRATPPSLQQPQHTRTATSDPATPSSAPVNAREDAAGRVIRGRPASLYRTAWNWPVKRPGRLAIDPSDRSSTPSRQFEATARHSHKEPAPPHRPLSQPETAV
jgi:hypothetical protein